MTGPTLLIMAAGMGARYGGLKQIEPVGPNGECIIDYSLHDAITAGFRKVVFVIRRSFEQALLEDPLANEPTGLGDLGHSPTSKGKVRLEWLRVADPVVALVGRWPPELNGVAVGLCDTERLLAELALRAINGLALSRLE